MKFEAPLVPRQTYPGHRRVLGRWSAPSPPARGLLRDSSSTAGPFFSTNFQSNTRIKAAETARTRAHERIQRGRIAKRPIGLGFSHALPPAGVRGVAGVTKPEKKSNRLNGKGNGGKFNGSYHNCCKHARRQAADCYSNPFPSDTLAKSWGVDV